MNCWKRKSHFDFFTGMDYPHFNICFDIEITATRRYAKDKGLSLFKVILYLSSYAANRIPELKTRIRGDRVVEHDLVHPAFTVLSDDHIFNFCNARFGYDVERFFEDVDARTSEIKKADHLVLDDPDRDDFLYITSLPWIKFTSVQHPVHIRRDDSMPRLSWGRFTQRHDRWWMPYSFQVHHGLADGYHAGVFFDTLQEMFQKPESYLSL